MVGFVKASDRLKVTQDVNVLLYAQRGAGKTYAGNMFPENTLFIDIEKGDKSLLTENNRGENGEYFKGVTFDVKEEARRLGMHEWVMCVALACCIGGYDPSAEAGTPYAKDQYDMYMNGFAQAYGFESADGFKDFIDGFEYVIWDSASEADKLAWKYVRAMDEAKTKEGKQNKLNIYTLHKEIIGEFSRVIQHAKGKSTLLLAKINEKVDGQTNIRTWVPDFMQKATSQELEGMFDVVGTMVFERDLTTGEDVRVLHTSTKNAMGYPAKSRGGFIDPVEKLTIDNSVCSVMNKIKLGVKSKVPEPTNNFDPMHDSNYAQAQQ